VVNHTGSTVVFFSGGAYAEGGTAKQVSSIPASFNLHLIRPEPTIAFSRRQNLCYFLGRLLPNKAFAALF
jgi:hypothetical protein